MTLLSVRHLTTQFESKRGPLVAVDDVSFDLEPGEVLGIVGESGSGKSVTALSLLRLVASPPGRIARGEARFGGRDLLRLTEPELRQVRGNQIAMIFQEPMTSLNPIHSVGFQIMEPLMLHRGLGRAAARSRAVALLDRVGIPSPRQRVDEYPHQLSGGMRQRVMIAMALACEPRLLIADEPTTALDVTIQAQILDLLRQLRAETGMAVILITHDLGVVAEFAERVIVMYAGRVVERAPVADLFDRPRHPYTEGLLRSIPPPDFEIERLPSIGGAVPNPFEMPPGCPFNPRCDYALDACRAAAPAMAAFGAGHEAACVNPRGGGS